MFSFDGQSQRKRQVRLTVLASQNCPFYTHQSSVWKLATGVRGGRSTVEGRTAQYDKSAMLGAVAPLSRARSAPFQTVGGSFSTDSKLPVSSFHMEDHCVETPRGQF